MPTIKIYSGKSITSKCRHQFHPEDEVIQAKEIIDRGKDTHGYSNCPDFISTVKYYGEFKGFETEFFLDGVSHGNNIDPIFEDFNKGIDLLMKSKTPVPKTGMSVASQVIEVKLSQKIKAFLPMFLMEFGNVIEDKFSQL